MKYCQHCGERIRDDAEICVYCGCRVKNADDDDASSAGFAILCFFIPILGLILWLVWKNTKPLRAKSCGKGALVSLILEIVIVVLYYVFLAGMIGALLDGTYYLLLR